MQLFYTPTSPYARKARIIIEELKIATHVELIVSDPRSPDPRLRAVNPLGKIPALILADGSALYDSPVICEYLDELMGGKFFPRPTLLREAKGKWRALTLHALCDGIMDATVRKFQELRLDEAKRQGNVLERQTAAIEGGLAMLDRASAKFGDNFTIGEVAAVCALGYLDVRFPADGWRDRYKTLAAWYQAICARPSVAATAPPPP